MLSSVSDSELVPPPVSVLGSSEISSLSVEFGIPFAFFSAADLTSISKSVVS